MAFYHRISEYNRFERCPTDGEHYATCPDCGMSVCIFCEDECSDCGETVF